jgi:hypothetical protein
MSRAAIWIAAVELPLLLWIAFLQLTRWGIQARWIEFGPVYGMRVVFLYAALAFGLLLVAGALKPNAMSLHGLYRDRLKRAFLFDPTVPSNSGYFPIVGQRVSTLSAENAPYHIINAALNIRGTSYANQRGRDADFFMFSPNFVGSLVTGYVTCAEFEKAEPHFDLATAMAVSGAAVSSSMGANSIRPLAPTLALLNIRLGYWLRNPRRLNKRRRPFVVTLLRLFVPRIPISVSSLFFEMTGRLYTDRSDEVYVTDGGHIENLGLYELLRRRCQLIICVDSEADSEMRFSSFMTLQRYASIDLGIQIELPWESIQKTAVQWMGYDPIAAARAAQPPVPSHGPHAAIGIIRYRGGKTGLIAYLKCSLTGDEPDYVRDYARRHQDFPHEPTGNQFFNEEQFEVYRALGFHMADGFVSGRDLVEMSQGAERPTLLMGNCMPSSF